MNCSSPHAQDRSVELDAPGGVQGEGVRRPGRSPCRRRPCTGAGARRARRDRSTSNVANEERSKNATASRAARCSSATGPNQLGRRKEYVGSAGSPGRSNQSGRSHPLVSPRCPPAAASRSVSGVRRTPRAAWRLHVRPVHRVEPAEALAGALVEVAAVPLRRGEAGDVHARRVEVRRAVDHPLGEGPAGAGGVDDALGVEAGSDEQAGHLRGLTEAEAHVGREGLRCGEEPLVRAGAQDGHGALGSRADRREVLPVRLELAEREVVPDGRHRPRLALAARTRRRATRPGCGGCRETRRGRARRGRSGVAPSMGAVVTWTCSAA